MNIEFLYHIWIVSIIFFIMSVGFKFFLKICSTLDLSYLGILIFTSYAGFYLNIHYWFGFIVSTLIAFISSIPLTIFLLYLSTRLEWLYFIIGTLTVYMLMLQIAFNAENITGWIFGISLESQHIVQGMVVIGIDMFFFFSLSIYVLVALLLWYIRNAYFYHVLQWWWENELSLKSMGCCTHRYKFFMILMTTFLAALWGNLYGFYNIYRTALILAHYVKFYIDYFICFV